MRSWSEFCWICPQNKWVASDFWKFKFLQLLHVELWNEVWWHILQINIRKHITPESDGNRLCVSFKELWKTHCLHDFVELRRSDANGTLATPDSWRRLYQQKQDEIKLKEERMGKRLREMRKEQQAAKESRTTKILDSPPVNQSGRASKSVIMADPPSRFLETIS